MRLPAALQEPPPRPFRIETETEPELARDRLANAVRERRYSDPRGTARGFLRLSGTVDTSEFAVRLRLYVIPGVISRGLMPIQLAGRIHGRRGVKPTVVDGLMSAPVAASTPAFLGISLLVWVGLGLVSGAALGLFAVAVAPVIAVVWVAMIRRSQRAALDRWSDVEAFLREVIERS